MPTRIRYLDAFMVGCGVGNRVGILDLTSRDKKIGGAESEFLAALGRLGLPRDELATGWRYFGTLHGAPGTDKEGRGPRLEELENLLVWIDFQIPNALRQMLSEQEYRWYKLGQLIYEPISLQILKLPYLEVNTALHAVTQELHLPESLRLLVGEYIQLLERPDGSFNEVALFAKRVEKTIRHFL